MSMIRMITTTTTCKVCAHRATAKRLRPKLPEPDVPQGGDPLRGFLQDRRGLRLGSCTGFPCVRRYGFSPPGWRPE